MTIMQQLERFVAPIKNKLLSMIVCSVIKSIDDSTGIQIVKLSMMEGEPVDAERLQNYGFTSNPPIDSESLVVFAGGNRAHGVVVATESSKHRIKNLPSGAVAIYNKDGSFVKLDGQTIEVNAGESLGEVKVVAKGNGNITIDAEGATGKVEVKAMKTIVNSTQIFLGEELLATTGGGVVTMMCSCVTGGLHPMGSATVKAKLT